MTRLRLSIVVAILIAATLSVFCVVTTEPPLATLGEESIRESDFQHYVEGAYSSEQVDRIRREPDARNRALAEYLDHRAVAAKAHRVGIDQDERFKKAVELMEIKTLAQLLTERYRDRVVKSLEVTPEQLKDDYERHRHELTTEPRFTAHHLLVYVKGNPAFPEKGLNDVSARAKASEALARLLAGQGWQAVAKRYSDDVATQQSGGLIRDRQFGYFAPEVEHAVRTQEIGKPGGVIKTMFGYYIIEVVERITERTPKPFDEVAEFLRERLTQQRSHDAREAFMNPIRLELGFKVTDAGARDVPLSDENALAPNEVLAEIAGTRVTESDFRWFCKDALLPSQRPSAFSRPGARQAMLGSYLDMLVLAAKAKRDHFDKTPEYRRNRTTMEEKLLLEFLQHRDPSSPAHQHWASDAERTSAELAYLNRLRVEAGLVVASRRR